SRRGAPVGRAHERPRGGPAWYPPRMAVYLDEEMVGEDRNEIGYPHLLLCMGVTVLMRNGRLIGTHITTGTTEAQLLAEVKRRIQSDPSSPYLLYVTGDLAK